MEISETTNELSLNIPQKMYEYQISVTQNKTILKRKTYLEQVSAFTSVGHMEMAVTNWNLPEMQVLLLHKIVRPCKIGF